MTVIHPVEDGTTHINVWSKARTVLGRTLSNFAHTPFVHPHHGLFASLEAYWYWLKTGRSFNQLRGLFGYDAKREGKKYPIVHDPSFETAVCEGLLCKVEQTPLLAFQLKESTLPLTHYYWYGTLQNDQFKMVIPTTGQFQIDYLEQLRLLYQQENTSFYE